METVVVRSMCDQCHSACGVLAHVQGGKVVKVEGDPNHPESRGFICVKGRAQPEVINHPDRVRIATIDRQGSRPRGGWPGARKGPVPDGGDRAGSPLASPTSDGRRTRPQVDRRVAPIKRRADTPYVEPKRDRARNRLRFRGSGHNRPTRRGGWALAAGEAILR